MPARLHLPPRKTPATNRTLTTLLYAALVWLCPTRADAQAWSERDVVQMAQRQSPQAIVARAEVLAAETTQAASGRAPDPSIAWSRQDFFSGPTPTQDQVVVNVPIDLSGRRQAQRKLASADASRTRAEAAEASSRAVALCLHAFYVALARNRRAELAEQAVAALGEAERVLSSREAAGSAAGLDRMRLTLELELARSELVTARIGAGSSLAKLQQLLGQPVDAGRELVGELRTDAPPSAERLLESARRHPVVAQLEQARGDAREAKAASQRSWWPTITLSGGFIREREDRVHRGYVAGLAAGLPLFSTGRSLRASARALESTSSARARARLTQLQAELLASHAELVATRAELSRFGEATRATTEQLLRATTTGYTEGQRSLVELLDARRAVRDVQARVLSLQLAAKHAEIGIRRWTLTP